MSDDLLSLRVLVVSRAPQMHNFFCEGAASAALPVEPVAAGSVAAARAVLARGADFVFMDASLSPEDRSEVVRTARAARNPPFLVLLAHAESPDQVTETDALATTPESIDDARQLIDRSMRVRLPSRVLIVDDSATMRSIVRKILATTRFPLEVAEACEGFSALKQVRNGGFDIVFLDVNMPEFNGFETLAELKREKRRASVVMMTSTPDEALADRARAEGAAFLRKPFYPADIDAVMCRFYGLRALNPQRP